MPDASSAEAAARPRRALPLAPGARRRMVLAGFLPALHLLLVISPALLPRRLLAPGAAFALALALLYLVPPLLHRLLLGGALHPRLAAGRHPLGSPAFLRWWVSQQCQTIFNRLPWLEELLRLLPGAYSAWLRLWGARVGRLVYWTPGVTVADRALLRVGHRVSFGAAARVMPHLIAAEREGEEPTLLLAPVEIGDDALVGGYALLLPGAVVAAGEIAPPRRARFAPGGGEATP